jgi:hypothetical protein
MVENIFRTHGRKYSFQNPKPMGKNTKVYNTAGSRYPSFQLLLGHGISNSWWVLVGLNMFI